MEANLKVSFQSIVRKGQGFSGLNYQRNSVYITRVKSVVLLED